MQLRHSCRMAAEGFRDLAIHLRDVLFDGGLRWFSLPILATDHGQEHLLPTFTRLVEHLEAFRSTVDTAVLQGARNLAQGIAEHIFAC